VKRVLLSIGLAVVVVFVVSQTTQRVATHHRAAEYARRTTERQRSLATELAGVVHSGGSQTDQSFHPPIRGRVMIWDMTKQAVDPSYGLLPAGLRASTQDEVITMFLITKRDWVQVGQYMISGEPAYQEHLKVGVAYWPERTSPGSVEVLGERPSSTRIVKHVPEYGSSVRIKAWIEALPRG